LQPEAIITKYCQLFLKETEHILFKPVCPVRLMETCQETKAEKKDAAGKNIE
jgi:hypothetical protein